MDKEYEIAEPIISKGRSLMNQTPFRIYKVDYEFDSSKGDNLLTVKYYYNKVNKGYKPTWRVPNNRPKQLWYTPRLYQFLDGNPNISENGILSECFEGYERGFGLWVIQKFISDNLSGGMNSYYRLPIRYMSVNNGRLQFSNNEAQFTADKLKIVVFMIGTSTIVGSGYMKVNVPEGLLYKRYKHYRKVKRIMKKILEENCVRDVNAFSKMIEKALPLGYYEVSKAIKEEFEKTERGIYEH